MSKENEQSRDITRRRFLLQTTAGIIGGTAGAYEAHRFIKEDNLIIKDLKNELRKQEIKPPSFKELTNANITLYQTTGEYKKQNRNIVNNAIEVKTQDYRFGLTYDARVNEREDERPSGVRMVGGLSAAILGYVIAGITMFFWWDLKHKPTSQSPHANYNAWAIRGFTKICQKENKK